jgi:Plasmid pRiA4b ORF-3-like protein
MLTFRCAGQPENYFLEAALEPIKFKTKQAIIRKLSVPAGTTFSQLHTGLQIAFQWEGDHAWEFCVKDCSTWGKRTEDSRSLARVSKFVYEEDFGVPQTQIPAQTTTLADLLEDPRYDGKIIDYVWDFSQSWNHIITVKGRRDATTHMKLTFGKGKPPPGEPLLDSERLKKEDRKELNKQLSKIHCGKSSEKNTPEPQLEKPHDEVLPPEPAEIMPPEEVTGNVLQSKSKVAVAQKRQKRVRDTNNDEKIGRPARRAKTK